jgi:hypothetical protein
MQPKLSGTCDLDLKESLAAEVRRRGVARYLEVYAQVERELEDDPLPPTAPESVRRFHQEVGAGLDAFVAHLEAEILEEERLAQEQVARWPI